MSGRDRETGRFTSGDAIDEELRVAGGRSSRPDPPSSEAEARLRRVLVAGEAYGFDHSRAQAAASLLDWKAIGSDGELLERALRELVARNSFLANPARDERAASAERSRALDEMIRDSPGARRGHVI